MSNFSKIIVTKDFLQNPTRWKKKKRHTSLAQSNNQALHNALALKWESRPITLTRVIQWFHNQFQSPSQSIEHLSSRRSRCRAHCRPCTPVFRNLPCLMLCMGFMNNRYLAQRCFLISKRKNTAPAVQETNNTTSLDRSLMGACLLLCCNSYRPKRRLFLSKIYDLREYNPVKPNNKVCDMGHKLQHVKQRLQSRTNETMTWAVRTENYKWL